jgi:hypothetical protein
MSASASSATDTYLTGTRLSRRVLPQSDIPRLDQLHLECHQRPCWAIAVVRLASSEIRALS